MSGFVAGLKSFDFYRSPAPPARACRAGFQRGRGAAAACTAQGPRHAVCTWLSCHRCGWQDRHGASVEDGRCLARPIAVSP